MGRKEISQIAERLAARFLERGSYIFSGPVSAPALQQIMPAAATAAPTVDHFFEHEGFSGLAVQSVGYEEGIKDPKIHIYVVKGLRKAEKVLSEEEAEVPIKIDRIGKVIVRPEASTGAAPTGNIFTHRGRVACGSSCAPAGEPYAGTLGALVRKRSGGTIYVLSNNHVLAACNHMPVGMPIMAPSGIDARPGGRAPLEVCRHAEIAELRSGFPSLVAPNKEDVALASVTDPSVLSSWQGDGPEGYDTPRTVAAPHSGMRVKKFGRTTGLTYGVVEARLTPFVIPYKARLFTASVWFENVWSVRAESGSSFALPGDSGSIVVDDKGQKAIGLVFAASPQGEYGIIVPMTHVSGLFGGISLVSGHGT